MLQKKMLTEFKQPADSQIRTAAELSALLGYDSQKENEIAAVSEKYKLLVTKYYAGLIEKGREAIAMQCVPDIRELQQDALFLSDPLKEDDFSPVPYLIHKYPDRAVFLASSCCFLYCRHCTRKNTAINRKPPDETAFQKVLAYLKHTPTVRDVLITGGDPFTLSDELLEHFISGIYHIESVQTIRIGTRAIVTNPERITKKLADMLAKYHPLWINTQFNHPAELTKQAAKACDILLSRGIPLGNQSVLLHGINDDLETMEQLLTGLIRMRVRPYYLYQLDNVAGTSHFYVPYQRGMELMEQLRMRIPGYALPRYVIDVPGKHGGKISIEKSHIIKDENNCVILSGREEGTTAEYHYHPDREYKR